MCSSSCPDGPERGEAPESLDQSAEFLILLSETFRAAEVEEHAVAAAAAEDPSTRCSPRITRKGGAQPDHRTMRLPPPLGSMQQYSRRAQGLNPPQETGGPREHAPQGGPAGRLALAFPVHCGAVPP